MGRTIRKMTAENYIKAAYAPSVKNDDDGAARHSHEAARLQQRITDLLIEVETLRETTKSRNALEDLVVQLRSANQNLVIATFGAQDLQASAEAANQRQEEFLSMLAHELRNPLAPVAMAAELLGKISSAHPQLPKLHGIIRRQVDHMSRLVDDLLDASRFSSGKIALQKRPLLLSDIVDSAVETSQPFIDKRNQCLIIELPAYPIVVNGDLVRLAQVFSNLLINAAKFSPEYEHITVSVRKAANAVTISVKDNGVGIAPDVQPVIFDLFTQGFRSLDRSQGGLGIGLSLVHMIVEMHGGSTKVVSAGVGFGSEFIVQLPISAESLTASVLPAVPVTRGRHCRILLIEDNADASEMLRDLLTWAGHTVTVAIDGMTGLAIAKQDTHDVIICDIGLPGMDGYQVIKELRRDALEPTPCYIAVSGYDRSKDQTHALEVGFDHYLVKPIEIDVLLQLVASSGDVKRAAAPNTDQ